MANTAGGGSGAGTEVFQISSDFISIQDRKEEAMRLLKKDVMIALDKEVKAMDDKRWMFDGPRSQIHLISRPGVYMNKKLNLAEHLRVTEHNQ